MREPVSPENSDYPIAEVRLVLRNSDQADSQGNMQRRIDYHDDGLPDNEDPFGSYVVKANDDTDDTFPELEENDSNFLEVCAFSTETSSRRRRISMFGSGPYQRICHGDPEALTPTSDHEPSFSSDTELDAVQIHHSSPDPVLGNRQLAISMQPWAAQVGLAGMARPVPPTSHFHRGGSSGRSTNRSRSLPHNDRFIPEQSYGGGPASSRQRGHVGQTSTGVQIATPAIKSGNLTGSANQRSSKSRAMAAVFRPFSAMGNDMQNRRSLWRFRPTSQRSQPQHSGPSSGSHVVQDNAVGSRRNPTPSAKQTSRDRHLRRPSRHHITPREMWEDEIDPMASSGSADGGGGVVSDDPDQTVTLSDTDTGGVVSRLQKRRRITITQAQAESSRAQRLASLISAVPGSAGQGIPNGPSQTGNNSTDNTSSQTGQFLRCDGPAATHYFLNNPTFSPFTPGTNVVFLSHLIPRHFDSASRRKIMEIFKCFAPYVPLCIMQIPDVSQMIWELGEGLLGALRRLPFTHPFGPNDRGWPSDPAPNPVHPRSLPLEIFEEIVGYLPRDSVQNMRLVNQEFERKVSRFAFRSVVVPFRPKIYGFNNVPTAPSTELPAEHSTQPSKAVKGKGKEKKVIPEYHDYGSSESSSEIEGKGKEKDIIPDDGIHKPTAPAIDAKGKGKGKETLEDDDESGQSFRDSFRDTYDPNAVHIRDGMRIFEHWGPEIKKFALTFEVPEDSLKGLLPKNKSTMQRTFWGSFEWPNVEYNRYDEAAILEDKADETSAMTTAFSKLRGLQELGLSMISGLGWLNGPDVSDRVKLYKPKPVVFGPQYALPDKEYREADEKWGKIVKDQTLASKEIKARTQRNFFKADREYVTIGNGVQCTMPKMVLKNYSPRARLIPPPIMFNNVNMEARNASELASAPGLDSDEYATALTVIAARTGLSVEQLKRESEYDRDQAIPNSLTREQKEWLMEMDWAQRAFLTSWCIAVLDNATIFHSLKRFTIGNISSGLLPSLQREDVWRALPNLEGLTVFVCPDWRQVTKNSSDDVDTPRINPSLAQEHFHNFLSALFAQNRSIKALKIGYVGGGEKAPGILSRNRNVVASPIMRFANAQASVDIEGTLYFPNVEHFTLVNCWITPEAVTDFFANMQDSDLQTVTLDSVSLIAGGHPYNHVPAASPGDPAAIAFRRNKWLQGNPTPGCWCDVINTITPGHGIDHMRILHGRTDIEEPELPFPTSLQKITFNSCGYVRLLNISHSFLDQSAVPDTMHGYPPACLRKRTEKLQKVMMQAPEDILLGTIVPALMDEEEGCLSAVWGMEMGWGKDREKEKWNMREDGAGEGGLGRFRGCVKRVEKGAGVKHHPLLNDGGFNGGRRGRSKRRAPPAGG